MNARLGNELHLFVGVDFFERGEREPDLVFLLVCQVFRKRFAGQHAVHHVMQHRAFFSVTACGPRGNSIYELAAAGAGNKSLGGRAADNRAVCHYLTFLVRRILTHQ